MTAPSATLTDAPTAPVVETHEVVTAARVGANPRLTHEIRRAAGRAFGEALASAGDRPGLDATLRPAARGLCDLSGAVRCSIFLPDAGDGTFRSRVTSPESSDVVVRDRELDPRTNPAAREALRSAAVVMSARSSRADRRPDVATLTVPLRHDDRVVGLAVLDLAVGRVPTPTAAAATAALGSLIARWVADQLKMASVVRTREQLDREREYRRRILELEQRLVATEVPSVDDVLDRLADAVERPVALLDAEGTVLARADLGRGRARDLPGADGRRLLGSRGAALPTGQTATVEVEVAPEIVRGYLVASLLLAGRPVAFVMSLEGAPAGAWSRHVAVRGGAACSVAALSAQALALADVRARALLVSGLLHEQRPDPELRALAEAVGVAPDRRRLVVTVSPPPSCPVDQVVATLRPLSAVAFTAAEDLVLVVDVPDDGPVDAVPESAADDPSRPIGDGIRDLVVAGIPDDGTATVVSASAVAADVADLRFALRQARALSASRRGSAPDTDGTTAVAVDRLGAAQLVLAAPEDARRMGSAVLGALLDDDPGARDLLRTLVTYLASNGGVQATAVTLGVHANTVRHRFARIRVMTGLDVIGTFEHQLLAHGAVTALGVTTAEFGED
jgi:hypothetical protein